MYLTHWKTENRLSGEAATGGYKREYIGMHVPASTHVTQLYAKRLPLNLSIELPEPGSTPSPVNIETIQDPYKPTIVGGDAGPSNMQQLSEA
jgi:hypothetical protein